MSTGTALNFDITFYSGARQRATFKRPDHSEADFIIRKALTPSHPRNICLPPFLFNPKSQSSSSKKHLPGEWEMHFFWQMREEELWDFVTQEAQSVSAHWCSELAGLSLWSPINSAVRLLPPSPRHTACSYTQPTAAPGNTCLSLPPDLGQTHSTAPLCPHTFFLPCAIPEWTPYLTNKCGN